MTDSLTQEEIDIGIRPEDKGGDDNIPLLDTTKCALPLIHLHTWPNKNVFACCLGGYDTKIGSLILSLEISYNEPNEPILFKFLSFFLVTFLI